MATANKSIENYQIIKTLGSGTFSKVKLGYSTTDSKYYAIKVHKADDPEFTPSHKETVMNEAK